MSFNLRHYIVTLYNLSDTISVAFVMPDDTIIMATVTQEYIMLIATVMQDDIIYRARAL